MDNKKLDELRRSVKLHLNWFVRAIAGDEALSESELKELAEFKALPKKGFDFVRRSFFLGRLKSTLKKKEYKELDMKGLRKAMKSAKLSELEKLAVLEAQQNAGQYLRSFASEIEEGIFSRVAATQNKIVSEATIKELLQDEVAFALFQKKTWQDLASSLAAELGTQNNKRVKRIARTEMHSAQQRGVVQAISNKVDIYGHSQGPQSKVSVLTESGRCNDCADLYENPDGSPKVFTLSKLLANGSNADREHKRTNGLHASWRPVVPPAHPHCFPAGTEILTKAGWKCIEDVQLDEQVLSLNIETKDMEYVPVKHTVESYAASLVEFSSRNYSLTCTPNHDLIVLTDWQHKNKKKLQHIPAKAVSKSSYLYRSSEWSGSVSSWDMFGFTPEQFCEFMGYFLSEGSLHPNRGQIDIAQFKLDSKDKMLKALEVMPFSTVSSTQIGIYLKNDELWEYLKQFGKSHEKFVPEEVKNLPPSYLEIFLNAFALGDGHRRTPKVWKGANFQEELTFFTSSDRLASDLGELLVKAGYVPSYSYDEPTTITHHNGTYTSKHGLWRIRRCYNKQASVAYMNITEQEHNDFVYCVELEKFNTLYVRQNGKCTWAGNCFCELKYIPPGYEWQGRKLVLVDKQALRKAIGDSAVSPVQKPKGPPQGPKTPKPGNVAGMAASGSAATVAGGGGSSGGNQGIEYEYWSGGGSPPPGDGWEHTSGTGWKRPKGSGHRGTQTPEEEHQYKTQKIQESIQWGKQEHPVEEHLTKLKSSNIVDKSPLGDAAGVTESWRVSLDGGGRALMKPPAFTTGPTAENHAAGIMFADGARAVPHGTAHKREVATYKSFMAMGLTDHVPPTTLRAVDGQQTSMQSWKEGYSPIHSTFMKEDSWLGKEYQKAYGGEKKTNAIKHLLDLCPEGKHEALKQKLSEMAVMGLAINHNDLHLDNVLVSEDWDVQAVDGSLTHGSGMDGVKNQIHRDFHNAGMKLKIPDKLMTRMKNTTLGDLKRAGGDVEDWAVGQNFLRQKYLIHLQETEGHLDYEKFRTCLGVGVGDIQHQPSYAFWYGSNEAAANEADKEFKRRKEAGLLSNQLFDSFAKAWIRDAKELPEWDPDHQAAKELDELGVFMGVGHAVNPDYRRDQKHREYEKSIKAGYPPKNIKHGKAAALQESAPMDIPKTQGARTTNAFGEVLHTNVAKTPSIGSAATQAADSGVRTKVGKNDAGTVAGKKVKKSLYIPLDRAFKK